MQKSEHSKNASVVILMATYNGEKFLAEQLESIAHQTHTNWVLIASDDGSTDSTLSILKKYQQSWGRKKLIIQKGPQLGFSHHFLSLATDPSIKADYYAFCDQDDIWMPTKLQVAINTIQNAFKNNTQQAIQSAMPILYCGRTAYFETTERTPNSKIASPKITTNSPLFKYRPSFRNALVQSIAGGNTMVFNQASKLLLEQTGTVKIVSHDWWLYLLLTAVGGHVIYDPNPQIFYRQHSGALIGGNKTISAKLKRVLGMLKGRLKGWIDLNLIALEKAQHLITQDNQNILNEIKRLRNARLIHRIQMIKVCGLYRQSKVGTLSLLVAVVLNRL